MTSESSPPLPSFYMPTAATKFTDLSWIELSANALSHMRIQNTSDPVILLWSSLLVPAADIDLSGAILLTKGNFYDWHFNNFNLELLWARPLSDAEHASLSITPINS